MTHRALRVGNPDPQKDGMAHQLCKLWGVSSVNELDLE